MRQRSTQHLGSVPGQVPGNKGETYRAEVLAEGEVNAIIGACSAVSLTGTRNRALITILYRGGLRIAEALALRPTDIDPDRGTVRVMDGKGHKPRTIGLEPGAMATVQRWADKRAQARIKGRTLLCTLDGGQMSQQYVRAMLRRAAGHAGITRRVVPHQLRHTHAAELVFERVPMPIIRDQLGHSSLAVTDRYLRDIAPAEVIETMRQRKWTEPPATRFGARRDT
jgi:site-specific recombinase XerD